MTPQLLSDWTIDSILHVLSKGLFETEDFDFKESLPHSQDDQGKKRLRKACCAFANANGGFLVFGVSNDRKALPADRLIGIDPVLDFPEHFGSYPQLCEPSVDWTFKNPPLALASGRVIHIIHIFKSWKAPHASGTPEDGWHFSKRTNKGNEGMNMDEVRSAFLNFYEKRLRLQLLRAEILGIMQMASKASIIDPATVDNKYSLVTYNLTVIESVISETYPLTVSSPNLLEILAQLRQHIVIANNKTHIFFSIVEIPMSNKDTIVRKHNEFMSERCKIISSLCNEAALAIDSILAPAKNE